MTTNKLDAIIALKKRVNELRACRKAEAADWDKRIEYLKKAKKEDLLRIDGMIREEMKVLHFIQNK